MKEFAYPGQIVEYNGKPPQFRYIEVEPLEVLAVAHGLVDERALWGKYEIIRGLTR